MARRKRLSIIFLTIFLGNIIPFITNSYGGDFDQGKALFNSKCMICHGTNGKGDGPAASALDPHPKDFTNSQFWQGNVDQKIADTIRNGHTPMPAFDLSDDEIKSITVYMKQAFKSN